MDIGHFLYLYIMQTAGESQVRRVILVYWKNKKTDPFEVYSNLRNFCSHYPAYSYNTLNNYLSKRRIPYENAQVYLERKIVNDSGVPDFKFTPVVRKGKLNEVEEEKEDIAYWLSRPPVERISAITFMISPKLQSDERLDKTVVRKRKMKHK